MEPSINLLKDFALYSGVYVLGMVAVYLIGLYHS